MGLGSTIGRALSGVRQEMQKSAKDKLYFDWTRNDALARLLELHVRLAYVVNHATYHPIARGDALLMDIELTAPRLEGLENQGIAEWMRKKDKAIPYWFEAVTKYQREIIEAREHPDIYHEMFVGPNPVDAARYKLERFFNFWLYPPAKPITELFDKFYHVPEYVVVRELTVPLDLSLDRRPPARESSLDLTEAARKARQERQNAQVSTPNVS